MAKHKSTEPIVINYEEADSNITRIEQIVLLRFQPFSVELALLSIASLFTYPVYLYWNNE